VTPMRALREILVLLVAVAALAVPKSVLAQDDDMFGPGLSPMGGMGGPAPSSSSKAPPKKAPDGTPELHAAPGGGDSTLPAGAEPALPDEPLKMSPEVRAQLGSDLELDQRPVGLGLEPRYKWYGPYFEERNGKYRFRTLFPLWAERRQPSLRDPTRVDRASLYGGFYYNRRSSDHADDILFPLFWNLRNPAESSRTTIVGPLVNRVAPGERDNWLAPLYFTGKRKDGGYTLIPPLLTYTESNADGGFNLVGPAFCSWKRGRSCDARTAEDIDFGVAPLYFFGQNAETKYEVIPPLVHYYGYDDRDLSWLNIWGPYYREHTQKRDMLHLLPVYWSIRGENERHTTVFPLFHYGWKDRAWLFVNPLFLLGRGQEAESTFVTWGYARYRGRTSLDMITPLYWHYRDPDIGLDEQLLLPFLYSRTSPRESNQAFVPFWAHYERYAIEETTWITPLFRHSHGLRGWSTAVNPVFYIGRNGRDTHFVVAPVFWDFAGPDSRSTVGFPLYWRFADRQSVNQLVGNVFYSEKKVAHGLDWQIHVFPAFSYGETPDGHWWNLLYGLAGYTRRGDLVKVRALWIPITLSGGEQ
jgi:hypothetical protein